MKSTISKGLVLLSMIITTHFSAMADTNKGIEGENNSIAVVGYFLLMIALIIIPAFKNNHGTPKIG